METLAQLGGLGCFQGGNWCCCPSTCLEGLWESRCCGKAQAELFRPRPYCWRRNMACQPLLLGALSSPPFWYC